MATQLLLIKDVEKLGRKGDIVNVKEGYSRNYLLPRGFAVPASKNALRRQEALKEERLKQAVEDKKDAEELSKQLATLEVNAVVKTDPDGNMYGSVTIQGMINLVKEQHGITLEKSFFPQKQTIKKLGIHDVALTLKEGVPAHLKVNVASDDATVVEAAIAQAKEEAIVAELPTEHSASEEKNSD